MEKPKITISNAVDTLGDFTYHRIDGAILKKDIAKDGGSLEYMKKMTSLIYY